MAEKKKTIFLTGATGLLGSYLLKIFLENGHKVYALARDKKNLSAEQRVKKILAFWDGGVSTRNLFVLKGDITKKNLGLSAQTIERIIPDIEEFFHCAASINLKWPLEKIREVNVLGTQNTLDFAKSCASGKSSFNKFNHISTAYIYGSYRGVFKEGDLDVRQKFNTTYEQSKFEAEKIALKYRQDGLWVDIFRPPIIVGHSRTGKILRFNNIYQVLSMCSLGLFNILPVKDSSLRLVPVDTVSEAIYLIAQKSRVKNKNYHPFPQRPVPMEQIISRGCEMLGIKKPKAVSLDDFDSSLLTPAQSEILENNVLAINFNNKLNSDSTRGLLEKYGFPMAEFDEKLLSAILGYFVNKRGAGR